MARSAFGLGNVTDLLGIFDDLGSVEFAAQLAQKHAAIARSKLKSLPTGDARSVLMAITEWLEARRR
jgi:geranylgeranyl pyrophosphate synthase